jgi:heat shock protein HslJ
MLRAVAAPIRAAGLQGWLRQTDVDGWVDRRPLSAVDEAVADALRGFALLVASVDELRGDAGPEAMARLRAWAGPRPELVVTAGTAGAWVDDGHAAPRHVPAKVVQDRHTIGAGDAFAAVLTARRGAGRDLWSAASEAATATARFLANRGPTTIAEMGERDTVADLAELDETRWVATRFGPGLQHAPTPESEFTLEIQADRLAGRSGCNRFMGTWSTVDRRLRIGQLASTMMFCDGLMELEGAYLAALQSATGVRAEEARLTFVAPDGTAVVELTRGTLAPET